MARPARPWFRFYVEAFADRKLLRLTPAQRWLWVAVLGAARESCEPGRLVIAEGEPMTALELARYADVPVDDVWPALEAMRRYGMVTWDDDGLISVCNWADRQFESDNTAVRTAKHRSQERSKEHPNAVTGNGSETETETEKNIPAATAAVAASDWEAWWKGYPQKRDKASARTAYYARRRAGTSHADLIAARDNYVAAEGASGFVKYGATFLRRNDGPWSEWVDGPPEPQASRLVTAMLGVPAPKFSEPARAVLGRGVDAEPIFDLDESGNAVARAGGER